MKLTREQVLENIELTGKFCTKQGGGEDAHQNFLEFALNAVGTEITSSYSGWAWGAVRNAVKRERHEKQSVVVPYAVENTEVSYCSLEDAENLSSGEDWRGFGEAPSKLTPSLLAGLSVRFRTILQQVYENGHSISSLARLEAGEGATPRELARVKKQLQREHAQALEMVKEKLKKD